MKKNSSIPSVSVREISMPEAISKFAKLARPASYPSIAFVHGFLCGITTTPSMISPSEWLEVLHGDIEFEGSAQHAKIWDVLLPLTNGLLTQIHHNKLAIPAELVGDVTQESEWQALLQWSHGFETANHEFKHLWDIILEEIEEKLAGKSLGNELWEKLTRTWIALSSICRPEILAMVRASEAFKDKTEADFRVAMHQEFQANLQYLSQTCEQIMLVRQRLRTNG